MGDHVQEESCQEACPVWVPCDTCHFQQMELSPWKMECSNCLWLEESDIAPYMCTDHVDQVHTGAHWLAEIGYFGEYCDDCYNYWEKVGHPKMKNPWGEPMNPIGRIYGE